MKMAGHFVKTGSKWIKDINAKYKNIKFLEDNIRENVDDFEFDNAFLDTTIKAQSMKKITDKLDLNKS